MDQVMALWKALRRVVYMATTLSYCSQGISLLLLLFINEIDYGISGTWCDITICGWYNSFRQSKVVWRHRLTKKGLYGLSTEWQVVSITDKNARWCTLDADIKTLLWNDSVLVESVNEERDVRAVVQNLTVEKHYAQAVRAAVFFGMINRSFVNND